MSIALFQPAPTLGQVDLSQTKQDNAHSVEQVNPDLAEQKRSREEVDDDVGLSEDEGNRSNKGYPAQSDAIKQ